MSIELESAIAEVQAVLKSATIEDIAVQRVRDLMDEHCGEIVLREWEAVARAACRKNMKLKEKGRLP